MYILSIAKCDTYGTLASSLRLSSQALERGRCIGCTLKERELPYLASCAHPILLFLPLCNTCHAGSVVDQQGGSSAFGAPFKSELCFQMIKYIHTKEKQHTEILIEFLEFHASGIFGQKLAYLIHLHLIADTDSCEIL